MGKKNEREYRRLQHQRAETEELAMQGLSDIEICLVLGIPSEELDLIAVANGRAQGLQLVTAKLRQMAADGNEDAIRLAEKIGLTITPDNMEKGDITWN